MRKGGEIDIKTYLCGSAPVQNILLEPRNSARVRSQRRSNGRSGRRICDEGARQNDFGRRPLGRVWVRQTPPLREALGDFPVPRVGGHADAFDVPYVVQQVASWRKWY